MLKTIRLKNFKLHEDTQIDAAPITVFIGPNNSGKSSIFQALLCLREACEHGGNQLLQPGGLEAGRILDLGDFANVVRSGETGIQISLSGEVGAAGSAKYKPRTIVGYDLEVRDNILAINSGEIANAFGTLSWSSPPTRIISLVPTPEFEADKVTLKFVAQMTFSLINASGYASATRIRRLPNPQRLAELIELQQFIASVPTLLVKSVHPVFALRGVEGWGYPLGEKKPDSLDLPSLSARAVALSGLLAYDRNLEESISERLAELVNIRIKVRLVEGKRVTIWAEPSTTNRADTLFVNEGTGANQLPFILIPIALTPRNETVLLSEPEAHLHPKAQCELTRMLLSIAKKENIQFFIETHSEHVLHVILNAVARGEWVTSDVALYYFENANGSAHARRLPINEHGQVDGGLPGFFDQSLTELTDYLKALSKT